MNKVAYELLLLMFNLANMHDGDRVIELFVEGLQEIFEPTTFQFFDANRKGSENLIPIKAKNKVFGSIGYQHLNNPTYESDTLIRNAVSMLAIMLERIELGDQVTKEKNTFKEIADKRLTELRESVTELEFSRKASINLIEDLNTEIERRRKYEQALKESEERWQFAVEGSGDGLWDWNLKTNKVYFSDRWKTMLGYKPDEVGDDLAEWEKRVHPDDIEDAKKDVQAHLNGETSLYQNEHRMLHKDGSYIWILDRGKIVSYDGKNKPIRFIGTHTDLTERIRSEKRIHESERKLSTLMSNLPGMAYRCKNDNQWTMKFVSSGSLHLTGYPPEDLMQNKRIAYGDLMHKEDVDRVWSEVQEALDAGHHFVLEYRIIDINNNVRWVWEQGLGIKSEGEIDFIEGFIMDITDRKNAEIELYNLKDDLEKQVQDKTKELKERITELERFHQATIDREFRIKELRDEIELMKVSLDNKQN